MRHYRWLPTLASVLESYRASKLKLACCKTGGQPCGRTEFRSANKTYQAAQAFPHWDRLCWVGLLQPDFGPRRSSHPAAPAGSSRFLSLVAGIRGQTATSQSVILTALTVMFPRRGAHILLGCLATKTSAGAAFPLHISCRTIIVSV